MSVDSAQPTGYDATPDATCTSGVERVAQVGTRCQHFGGPLLPGSRFSTPREGRPGHPSARTSVHDKERTLHRGLVPRGERGGRAHADNIAFSIRGCPGSFLSPRMGASARSQGRQPLENGPPSPAGFPPSAAPTPGDARGWGGGRGNGCGGDPGPGADAPGYVLTPLRGFPDSLLEGVWKLEWPGKFC